MTVANSVGSAPNDSLKAMFAPSEAGPWLFGRTADLLLFGGSALVSVLLVAYGAYAGILERDSPEWVWLGCIVAVDVAHVWSTCFRVYLDGAEVRRRPWLYLGVPVLCYVAGVGLHLYEASLFWRVLAYGAVFHFVRQQYGWVALYRRRAREEGELDRLLDKVTIYTATLFPLLWWHGHLPRKFTWFVANDFVAGLAASLTGGLAPCCWCVLGAFVVRQLYLLTQGLPVNVGKVVVVLTTWLCWWLGIMALDSDYAFTVTNVLIHGVPYLALTYRYGRARGERKPGTTLARMMRGGVIVFVLFILIAAAVEETFWDRLVWHDREWLFGAGDVASDYALAFIVPLLALPQAAHYALDGFLWKLRRGNPAFARAVSD